MIQFEWNDAKEAKNRKEHEGVDFEQAMRVFDDPHNIVLFDRIVDGEPRWQIVGMVESIVLLVGFTYRGDPDDPDQVIRIFTARKAVRWERREYEQNRAKDAW